MARPRKSGERKPNGKLKHKQPVIDERLTAAKYRIRDFGVSLRECTSPLAGDLVGVLLLRRLITHEHWVGYRNYLRLAPPDIKATACRPRAPNEGSIVVRPSTSSTCRASRRRSCAGSYQGRKSPTRKRYAGVTTPDVAGPEPYLRGENAVSRMRVRITSVMTAAAMT
jgi:hypothetical protein